jgi:serine protease Do
MLLSLARSFGLERPRGALVADVPPNSPAASAGIQRGDVIIAFNGRQLEDIHELPRIVANILPGNVAEVRLPRSRLQICKITGRRWVALEKRNPCSSSSVEAITQRTSPYVQKSRAGRTARLPVKGARTIERE